ncbi:MAG: nickel pincer cofactor biosynthesis protein LarC [Rubripirellula sp.]
MGRIAYFDCISGISGDMTLGALVDLGADVAAIESAVRSMGLPELSIRSETVKKRGFRAIQVHIEHPPEHAHRHLHHITEMIDRATEVPPEAKQTAHKIFHCVAEAEAKVHGSTLEKVHFHEVGAIDSIADIVGASVALQQLEIDSIVASAVPTGTGEITIAHGRVSVPAPATAEILRGIPIATSDIRAELTTPTGAAILKACASSFGSLPSMTIEAAGYGSGSMDLDAQANVLRVLMGQSADSDAGLAANVESDRVVVLESNVDDSTPEELADCCDRLMSAGALDVFQTPCMMKKGRSGVILTAIVSTARVHLAEQVIFRFSSSIGIRRHTVDRHKLPRESVTVDTQFGPVRGKTVALPDGQKRFTVEDDDARTLATSNQTTPHEIRRRAHDSFERRQ